MEIKYNIEKSQRKALAQKIGELTGAEVEYLGVPSCAYQIDIFTLSKDAVLSFTDRSDTEIVEKVLDGLAEAGYTGETVTYPAGTETDSEAEPEDADADTEQENTDTETDANDPETETDGFPIAVTVAFPLADHTVQSLTNLICMIHARGALLSKATGGEFFADKSLADAILDNKTFRNIHELIAYIREWEETNPELKGIRFADDKLIFDGFGEAPDADHVQAFTNLAAAMNGMAIMQKRVQAKDVDDSNEKYVMRVWLVRIGFGGADHKTDRRILLEHLTGHTAFRNDEERAKWTERQKAKREAARAAAQVTEEEEIDAVSE